MLSTVKDSVINAVFPIFMFPKYLTALKCKNTEIKIGKVTKGKVTRKSDKIKHEKHCSFKRKREKKTLK